MTEEMVMSIGAEAIKTTIYLAGPLLLAAMAVGIIVSVLQAITQINEATLTFIPKMIAVLVVLTVMAPWMMDVLQTYTAHILTSAGEIVRIMSLFNFNQDEIFSFFAVLVRYSVLMSILPFVGDRYVPQSLKILFSLAITIALFPALVASGQIQPSYAAVWAATPSGIVSTIGLEVLFALALGFTARMTFESVYFGANLVGSFMGFASASTYDPSQESQTQIVAEIQIAIAMLVFLSLDGHHLMLRAALDSYRIVGIGKAGFNSAFSAKLIDLSSQVVKFGIQIASPVAFSLFAVNVVFGVMSKAMPQVNILVLSFAVTALIGFIVMFLGLPEFQSVSGNILSRVGDWMEQVMLAMASGK